MGKRGEISTQKIRDFKNKDAKAMEDVIDIFSPLVKACSRTCVKASGFALDFDDAKQDMIVALIETIFDIPLNMVANDDEISRRNILAYIKKSLYRQCMKPAVEMNRRTAHETEYTDEMEYIAQEDTVEDLLISNSIRAKISNLPKRQQEVITLKLQGYNGSEISALLGVTPSAVSQILKNAHGLLINGPFRQDFDPFAQG